MFEKRKLRWSKAKAAIFLGICALLLVSTLLMSQPVRDRILNEVLVSQEEETVRIQVFFTDVFRYVTHFPHETGDQLRIRIEPVAVSISDRSAVFQREAVRPPGRDDAKLIEVLYEGDIPGGPFLTLFFTSPVNYEVVPGADFRSITVVVLPTT